MKLKTLLLGSAAAMIAVSGARAADAVVAEPEPMEYVKVCDMYGAGFYYIPGTETCMNINGYVRVDYTYNDRDNAASTSTWQYRARVNIDVRNETDWGTLRSQVRLQGDGDAAGGAGADADVGIDRALISLGGLRFGYSDAWNTTFHGYGNFNEKYDGYYAYHQAMLLDYTYAANGFSATVGVQDTNYYPSIGGFANGNHVDIDVYAGLGYSASWGAVRASYLHEDATDEGVIKVSADLNIIDGLSLRGVAMFSDGAARVIGDYQYTIGARYAFADNLSADINYSDADANDASQVAIGVRWAPVPGLSIRPTAVFRENDNHSYSLRVYRTW